MSTHVALLRGINVGGRNTLPMADLRAIFEELDASEVRTYVQSGNVVFACSPSEAASVCERASVRIEQRFGHRPPMVIRSAEEMRRVLDERPVVWRARARDDFGDVPDAALHVAFLADAPSAAQIAALDPARSPGDSVEVRGRDVYLHLPNGVARSKLTNAYFDATLKTTSTIRNGRTIGALVALCEQAR